MEDKIMEDKMIEDKMIEDKIIDVCGLKKSYGKIEAVKGIDFYVEKGKLFAFLGPNGAGKSTTINMICTLLGADEGEVLIDGFTLGKEDQQIRARIGVVFQESMLDPLLTVEENLETRGKLYQMTKKERKEAIQKACEVADVNEFLKRQYGSLSGGQRRRADIARALIHHPNILVLDEPTTGLDPQTRKSVWNTIKELQKKQGMTVFLTTHYMEEAANADYVVIIDDGIVAAKGTPVELKEQYGTDFLKLNLDSRQVEACLLVLKTTNLTVHSVEETQIQIALKHTMDAIPVIKQVEKFITGFEVIRGTLDDVFIQVTGKEMREDV